VVSADADRAFGWYPESDRRARMQQFCLFKSTAKCSPADSTGGWLEGLSEISVKWFVKSVDRIFGDANRDLKVGAFRIHSVQLGGSRQ